MMEHIFCSSPAVSDVLFGGLEISRLPCVRGCIKLMSADWHLVNAVTFSIDAIIPTVYTKSFPYLPY